MVMAARPNNAILKAAPAQPGPIWNPSPRYVHAVALRQNFLDFCRAFALWCGGTQTIFMRSKIFFGLLCYVLVSTVSVFAAQDVVITEFMSANSRTLADDSPLCAVITAF